MRDLTILALAALALVHPCPSRADISADKRTAARVFVEKMGQGDFSRIGDIYGPDFMAHSGGQSYSLDYDNASTKALREAVPDIKVKVENIIGQGNLVAVHWSATGTNTVAAAGLPGLGKVGSVQGMTFFRFAKGKIVEEWSVTDMLMLMRQLGMSR
ncbi:ester cyclase [Sphingomonas sp. SUN039]|uniref:ester cyclase n=1 Tax=Sphingomonas sp. SUN039 TaxID=2937787 RepID=UPI002164EA49|nr:ester cyclase [Sphingomonas sp. SUN039]UVO55482.1 ester cyclase [Sphingomonas sp. SUN039]